VVHNKIFCSGVNLDIEIFKKYASNLIKIKLLSNYEIKKITQT